MTTIIKLVRHYIPSITRWESVDDSIPRSFLFKFRGNVVVVARFRRILTHYISILRYGHIQYY